MSIVVGIDADVVRLAYAVLRAGRLTAVATIQRTDYLGRVVPDYDHRLDTLMARSVSGGAEVWLEDIYLASGPGKRNVRAFASLARVQGEIYAAARRNGLDLHGVLASRWQPSVLGLSRGRDALKAASMQLAQREWARPLTDHEADAVCIAKFGLKARGIAA